MLTGFEGPAFNVPDFNVQRRPCMGSATAKLVGARKSGLPPYAAVPHLRGGTDNFFHYAAYLGRGCNPFVTESDPNDADFRVRNLSLPPDMPLARLEDRRHLLESLDAGKRAVDARQRRPRPARAAGVLAAHQQGGRDRVRHRRGAEGGARRATAGTRSARARCSRGGWSKPA